MAISTRLHNWVSLEPGTTDWIGGLRLACAFLLPVAVGVGVDQKLTGLFVGVGAFMVANADLGESFGQRLRSMVPSTLAIPAMTALGMTIGSNQWIAAPVGALVILTGSLIAAVGRESALFGIFFSFAYIVGVGVAGAGLTIRLWRSRCSPEVSSLSRCRGLHAVLVQHRQDEPPEPWSTVLDRARAGLADPIQRRQAIGMAVAGAIGLAVVPFTNRTGFRDGYLWQEMDGLRDFLAQRDGFFDERHTITEMDDTRELSNGDIAASTTLQFFLRRWTAPAPRSEEFTGTARHSWVVRPAGDFRVAAQIVDGFADLNDNARVLFATPDVGLNEGASS